MRVLIILLVLMMSRPIYAQDQHRIRPFLAVYTDLPTGLFRSVYTLNLGISAGGTYPLSSKLDVSASGGYSLFGRRGNYKSLPLLTFIMGGKYRFSKNAFIKGSTGLVWPIWDKGIPVFSLVPAMGFVLSSHFDIQANYHAYVQSGFLMGSAGVGLIFYPGNKWK